MVIRQPFEKESLTNKEYIEQQKTVPLSCHPLSPMQLMYDKNQHKISPNLCVLWFIHIRVAVGDMAGGEGGCQF